MSAVLRLTTKMMGKLNPWSKPKKLKAGAPFHERHRSLLIMGCFGGIYNSILKKIFVSPFSQWIVKMYTVVCLLFLGSFPFLNLIHLFFVANKLYQVTMDLMILVSGLHAFFRIVPTVMQQQKFSGLYELWDEFFGSDSDVVERQKHIDKHYADLKKQMRKYTFMAAMSLNPWMVAQYFSEDKVMKVPTPLPYRSQSPDYELLVTFYLFPCAVHALSTSAIHLYMLLPILWVLAELERLKFSLRSILSLGGNLETPSPQRIEQIKIRLGVWIKQHQKLIIFYRKAQQLVWISFSIEMLATFMAAWLTAFNYVQDIVVEDKVTQIFFYLPYVLMFAVTCYYCDLVKNESESLIDEAYTADWMTMPKNIRSSLVIIAQQTQIPYIIKGFAIFPTGYLTFAQIMQSAYSVLNFLLAAQE